ncbi:MAG: FIST N-terminal domain-containing protein [Actinomycetota bacterium]
MSWAVGVSTHPSARDATGEVIGQLLERVGDDVDVATVFVSGHRTDLDEILAALRATLSPRVLVGTSAGTIVGGARELTSMPALSVLAGRADGVTGLRLRTSKVERGTRLDGLDPAVLAAAHSVVLLADRHTFPAAAVLAHLQARHPHLTVVGGVASGVPEPGAARLILDGSVTASGAVALAFSGPTRVEPVVSHGCRPIGDPLTVTASDGPMVLELGGRPAAERLAEVLRALEPEERSVAATGLLAGIVVDEQQESFGPGDFLIRAIRAVDREGGGVAIGDRAPLGSTFQFQLRDADRASIDLGTALLGHRAQAALLFTCEGRGERLFGHPDHDAAAVSEALGTGAISGMACAAEIGPVGGLPRLHGFTASVGLLVDRA